MTGVSSRVAMPLLDRMLQDCWLNWEEDLRWAYRDHNTAQGILEHWGLAGEGNGICAGEAVNSRRGGEVHDVEMSLCGATGRI